MTSSSISGSRSSSISHQPQQRYPYYQDAVRIFVQQVSNSGEDEDGEIINNSSDPMTTSTSSIGNSTGASRRFSVDPQLTNFDILRNLIGRAFDMKRDFAISYRAFDDLGGETYLPLVSDWDLSAAFLSASDPDLQLLIEPKNNIPSHDVELDDEPWDVVQSTEVIRDASQNINHTTRPLGSEVHLDFKAMSSANSNNHHHHNYQYSNDQHQQNYYQSGNKASGEGSSNGSSSSKVLSAMSQLGGAVNQYPISLNSKINTVGIFNTMEKWVQKAKTFVEDLSVVTTRPPLSDVEFRNYLDPGGVLCRPRELRYACYHGGIEPGLRKVVWKHLLNIYPNGLSGNARMEYVRNKSKDYYELRDTWKSSELSEDIQCISNMVRKDVLRTDRHLQFYAGQDDNQNIAMLFNILTTYALNHPSVGYCQGMSDLASPLLWTMGDEAQAYICFCALMERMKPNFNCDGLSMSLKFSHLAETVAFYDPDFWSYLKMIGADDLLFCYRWLILELKREFAFEDALRMMEVCFASLPYKPQDVPLFEVKFTLSNAHAIPIQVANNSLTSSYSRVCALRRSSTSLCGGGSGGLPNVSELRGRRFSRKPKANPLSLDENSLTSVSSISTSLTGSGGGGSSFGGSVVRSHTKPFYSLDETTEGLSACDFMTGSPFEMLNLDGNLSSPKPKKLIKNLKEFWTIAKGSEDPSPDSTPFSSKSSTMSNLEAALGPMTSDSDCNGGAVFFDDLPPEKITSINSPISVKRQNVISTSSPPLTTRSRHSSCNSSSGKVIGVIPPRMTTSSNFPMSAVATATPTKTSGSTSFNPISPRRGGDEQTTNLSKSENKSEQFANHDDDDDNNSSSRGGGGGFLPIPTPASDQDPERTSQTSNADSEHDSGHCYGNSTELFESLNDPQFSRGRAHVKMPSPDILGGGNPFLMFLCLTLLLQHRDHIMKNGMDYNETAMYFDKLIRKHNVGRVLAHARMLYSEYLKNNAARA